MPYEERLSELGLFKKAKTEGTFGNYLDTEK